MGRGAEGQHELAACAVQYAAHCEELAYMFQQGYPFLADHLGGWHQQACWRPRNTVDDAGGGLMIEFHGGKLGLDEEEEQEEAHAGDVGVPPRGGTLEADGLRCLLVVIGPSGIRS